MRKGLSLLEVLMVVTIMGILSAIVIPRLTGPVASSKAAGCHTNKATIDVQTQLWMRNKGSWPASDLSDIGADPAYFPDGLPTCPAAGGPYQLDPVTGRVLGHNH